MVKIACVMPPELLFLKAGCWAVDVRMLELSQAYLCQAFFRFITGACLVLQKAQLLYAPDY